MAAGQFCTHRRTRDCRTLCASLTLSTLPSLQGYWDSLQAEELYAGFLTIKGQGLRDPQLGCAHDDMVTSSFLAFALPPSVETSREVCAEEKQKQFTKCLWPHFHKLEPLGDSGNRLVSWPEVTELRKLLGWGLGEEG